MSTKDKPRFQLDLKSASVGTKDPEINKVQKFLTRFGYLTSTITPGKLDEKTSEALEKFQQVTGLKVTGKLDAKTVEALQRPRCGNPDVGVIAKTRGGAVAKFVLIGCSYNKTQFTYRFLNVTSDITDTQVRDAVQRAFNTWADALCGVTFEERTADPVDFKIGWFSGDHGDVPFGNDFAHASYPPPCGDVKAGELHFDEDRTWGLTDTIITLDLETVALHEIGHLLGLDHSSVTSSIMFVPYSGMQRTLSQDDLDGIRRLYPFFCRRGDSGSKAGFVSEIAAARHNQRQIINAVRAQDRTLKLIAWNVAADGEITREGDSGNQAGVAKSIAIARNTTDSRFVTACRNSSKRLFLISWDVDAGGTTITRLADSGTQAGTASLSGLLAGTANLIRIVALGSNRFVTACRDSNGSLKLITWRLNNDGSLMRLADSGSQAGDVSDIALVALSNTRVLTAVRASEGTLKLISWSISNTAVTRLADSGSQAGKARFIRAVVDQAGHVVTAVKAGDNSLKLITWAVTGSGSINRLNDSGAQAGETDGHDISMAGRRVVTGVRAGDGHLKVILWQTANDGSITRVGDSANLAGGASMITQCEELTGAPPIITSVRTTTNNLKLISWSTP